jgi:hypothetical protein
MSLRADLDAVEKRNISRPCRKLNNDSSIVEAVDSELINISA